MREPLGLGRYRAGPLAVLLVAILGPSARAQPGAAAPAAQARALAAEGLRLLEAGQPALAEPKLALALRLDPTRSEAHYALGFVREGRGELRAARESYEAAVRLDPNLAEAHDRLGFVLGRLGDVPAGIVELEKAVRLNPRLFDAQYHLGATLWWTKDMARARPAGGGGPAETRPRGSSLLPGPRPQAAG
jgi:Tfp pilus assembly protein PilF